MEQKVKLLLPPPSKGLPKIQKHDISSIRGEIGGKWKSKTSWLLCNATTNTGCSVWKITWKTCFSLAPFQNLKENTPKPLFQDTLDNSALDQGGVLLIRHLNSIALEQSLLFKFYAANGLRKSRFGFCLNSTVCSWFSFPRTYRLNYVNCINNKINEHSQKRSAWSNTFNQP